MEEIEIFKLFGSIMINSSEAEGSLSKITGLAEKVGDKMQSFGKSVSDVGAGMTKWVTGPLVAVGTGALAAANSFDKAIKTIRAGTGATGEALAALGNDFKSVFKDVPASADTVATAIADLNTRTGATGETLQILATRAVELAKLTGGDVSTQIAAVTRVFGDWGISVESQAETMDYLWKVSQSTGIGIDALSQKVVQFGAPLRQMGFDFETSAALIGKWEKEGVNAELVLGSLRIALGKMAKEGVTDTNAALTEMTKRIKEAGSTGEANALAMELFGAKAGPDMAAAIREGRFEIDELLTSLSDSSETILTAANDTRSFADSMEILKNKAQTAIEPLGAVMLDLFTVAQPAIKSVINAIQVLSEKFQELSPRMQTTIIAVAGFVAALGPVLIVVGKVISIVGSLISAFGGAGVAAKALGLAFTLMTGPVGIIIAALAALVAGIVYLWNTNEDFRDAVINIWNEIQKQAEIIFGKMQDFWDKWGDAITLIFSTAWNNIKIVFETLATIIGNALAFWLNVISGNWSGVWQNVKNVFEAIWNLIKGIFQNTSNAIQGITNQMASYVLNRFSNMVSSLQSTMSNVYNAITDPFRRAWNEISRIATNIRNEMNKINPFMRQSPSLVDNVRAGVKVIADEYSKLGKLDVPSISNQIGFTGSPATASPAQAQQISKTASVNVQTMNVYNDGDINKTARELKMLETVAGRRLGLGGV